MNKEWFNKIDEDKIILPKRKNSAEKNLGEDKFELPQRKDLVKKVNYLKVPDIKDEDVPIKNIQVVPKKQIVNKNPINLQEIRKDQALEDLKKLKIDLEIQAKKIEELRKLQELQQKLNQRVQEQKQIPKIELSSELAIKKEDIREPEVIASDVKTKIKPKPAFYGVLVVSFLAILISGYKIINWYLDSQALSKQIKELTSTTKVEEVNVSDNNVELVNEPEPGNPNNDYWNFMNMPLINVDFTELLKKNSDTVGFIKVNGTNINYPIVQTTDNDYYLTHSFDKKYNGAGWVFLDYRNDLTNLQDNTIIYAHARKDRTMFGSLRYALNADWFQNKDNYIINLSTPTENTQWQIISAYTIPTETYYLISEFGSEESHQKYIDTILSRSVHKFNTEVSTSDKLLTLSTCYTGDNKMVIHAKLIKRQVR